MRHFIILITVVLAAALASASPLHPEELVQNLLGAPVVHRRVYRSVGGLYRRNAPAVKTQQPLDMRVRKGEYVCGDKICKLKPGEKPPCQACQYPVRLHI